MPEIKSTFTRGTMNKDLDERLIPSGHYRDAVNVNVTTSDGGGAGTVRNLLGNTRIDTLVPDSMFCVGSVADERNNKLYWFVFGEDKHAILEYDQSNSSSQIILADMPQAYSGYKPFLNFTGKQITGINIVDNFLFWSDGDNEPKKINISRSFHTNGNLAIDDPNLSPAYLHVNGQLTDVLLNEEHITVIKKKPTSAPTVKLISAKGEAGSAIFEKVFIRFCIRYKYADGEYSAFGPFTDVVFNPEHNELINSVNAYSTDEPYNKSMVNLIKSVELYDFISPDMPADVVQVDILYKQEDSTAIYSIENIKTNSAEANHAGSGQFMADGANSSYKGKYEVTSENIHAVLPSDQLLRPFDIVPKSALGQEIVGNRLVYANYKQGYDFSDNIPVINAYKINRPSQDFSSGGLKSLKSQRKYQLGYILGDKYGRETPVFTSRQGGVDVPWSETNGSANASNSTMLKAQLFGDLPDWADYYKFYVKSSSDEYYNLLMDRSYFPFTHNEFVNKDDHIYISFPSSDRNKIMEDDYIIAKKIYDSNSNQIPFENKYKILDITNEAPDAVKYVFFSLGSVENTENILCSGANEFGVGSLFPGPNVPGKGGKRIDQQVDTIHMSANAWMSTSVDGFRLTDPDSTYNKDIYISWNVANVFSERYKVTSIDVSADNNNYVLKLSTKISEKDAKLAAFNDSISSTVFKLDSGLEFRCERREVRGEEDLSGKFFVKIKHNDYLTGNDQSDSVYPINSAEAKWLFGSHNLTNGSDTDGIINSSSSAIANSLEGAVTVENSPFMNVTGMATSALEWDSIKSYIGNKFFIDDMNFIASNPSASSYAKESGNGFFGELTIYPEISWTFTDSDANNFSANDHFLWALTSAIDENYETGITGEGVYSIGRFSPYRSTYSFIFNQIGGPDSRINSVEGIVNTTDAHTGPHGERQWISSSIYDDNELYRYDNTYGDDGEVGKHFMHLSFLAPGVDLITIDSSDLEGVSLAGSNSISTKLQGIWGGGAITKVPESYGSQESFMNPPLFGNVLGGYYGSVVEFESNPGNPDAPGPGVGLGYDSSYQVRHEQQWNPAFSDAGNDPEIEEFVARLKTPGQKFKFKSDVSNTVYTILSVSEKHLYNHTSWRLKWLYNDTTETGSYITSGNVDGFEPSVEEAASAWADFATSPGPNPSSSNNANYAAAATNFANALNNFGAAHNRRTCFILELDKDPQLHYDPRFSATDIDATDRDDIEFITTLAPSNIDSLFSSPTIWETEPQQLTDLNIYYEASNNIPTKINNRTNELFAPVGSIIKHPNIIEQVYILEWTGPTTFKTNIDLPEGSYIADEFTFCKHDDTYVKATIIGQEDQNIFTISEQVQTAFPVGINWFNCFSFGDGIESDRIRDGYNKMRLSSGARVSAVLEEPFIEEHRTNGLIYSGIYNSNSNLNNLNQFIAAEKITKDINPTYGSIQKLFTRNTDLVALCEDRIIKILANKDAVFNADGNPQLVATERVLGQSVPFAGDYGISTHPESFASDAFRAYFTDKQRGSVLRLYMDGLTPISESGMRDYFRDNLVDEANFIGSYDRFNQQYNLTIKKKPVIGSILNDDLSIGAGTTEYFNPTEFITNGTFTQGLSFSGQVLLEDLPLEERTLNQNPTLEGNVTIINHPEITDLVPSQPIMSEPEEDIEIITIDDVNPNDPDDPYWETYYNDTLLQYSDVFHSTASAAGSIAFGWKETDLTSNGQEGDPFDAGGGIRYGGNGAKMWMSRYRNTSVNDNTDHNIVEHPNYGDGDFNIGFGVGESGGGVSGNSDAWEWDNAVRIFAETAGTSVPSQLQGNDEYHVSTTHKGITFRGSPGGDDTPAEGTPWGYIEFPNFTSDANHTLIPNELAASEPTAQNNTIFHGEEFRIFTRVRANCYGDDRRNHITVKIFDGASLVDESLFTGGTTNNVNIDSDDIESTHNDGWCLNNRVQFEDIHDVDGDDIIKTYSLFFKVGANSTNIGDIAIQNLRVRIEVWSSGSNTDSNDLDALGETVIEDCLVSKIYRLTSQDYTVDSYEVDSENEDLVITIDNTPDPEIIGYTDPIPLEPIPAWAEVIYPDAIEGFIAEGANIDHGLEEQFGPENPGELVTYTDLEGNEQTYLSGSSNGVTEYSGDASEITVPINHLVTGFNVSALLDPDTTLELDKWYMVQIKLNQFIAGPEPFIKFMGGDSGMTTYNYFSDDPSNLQIGSYINGSTITLAPVEVLPTAQIVHRALFRLHSNASNADTSQINKMLIGFYNQDTIQLNESVFEEVRLIDVSVEATGGFADNWNINPENYQIQRAVIESANLDTTLNVPQNTPAVYYMNGQINFSTLTPGSPLTVREVSQDIQTLQPTQDGYELVITLSDDALSGISAGWEGPNVFTPGTNNQLTVSLPTAGIEALALPDIINTIPLNFNGEGSGSIIFNAPSGFTGSIKSVSLKDITNYFSAGSAGVWIIEGNTTGLNPDGEEVVVENFIEWSDSVNDDGQIFFNGATSGSRIYQEVELPVGQTFQLTFDAGVQGIPTPGSLKVSYRNASGIEVGQKLVSQATDGDNLLFEFTVDEGAEVAPQDLPNCIIFEAIGDIPLHADVDNIKLRRVITDEEFGADVATISYKESAKGWVSFKSFIPESGLSLSSQYFTFQHGQLWQHDTNDIRNNFYGIDYDSSITTIMNQLPSVVKSFDTVNYEGSEDWMLSQINTDLDQGTVNEFVKKENKWFNYIKGSPGNFDTSRLNVQGLGFISHTTED